MKKFEFKLSAVHKVRELKEEKETAILARLRDEVRETEQLIDDIESKRMNLMEEYLNGLQSGSPVTASELDLYSQNFASLEKRRIQAEQNLKEKKAACTKQVRVLSDAARQVEVTKTLRNKQETEHKNEVAKREQGTLDEITGAKYATRKATEQNEYDFS